MGDKTARCQHCKRRFTYRGGPDQPRQHICRACFYEHRGDFTGAIEERAWEAGYREGHDRTLAATEGLAENYAKLRELLPLDDAIALCHPDRHPPERSAQANAVTAQLLELRTVLRATAEPRG